MEYTKYYLKFSSEQEANLKLHEVNFMYTEDIDGETFVYYKPYNQYGNIDIIGEIYNEDAVFDEETFEEITPATKKPGWHVNLILSDTLPKELEEYIVTPDIPYRIFN
jgi:hypothetical protein